MALIRPNPSSISKMALLKRTVGTKMQAKVPVPDAVQNEIKKRENDPLPQRVEVFSDNAAKKSQCATQKGRYGTAPEQMNMAHKEKAQSLTSQLDLEIKQIQLELIGAFKKEKEMKAALELAQAETEEALKKFDAEIDSEIDFEESQQRNEKKVHMLKEMQQKADNAKKAWKAVNANIVNKNEALDRLFKLKEANRLFELKKEALKQEPAPDNKSKLEQQDTQSASEKTETTYPKFDESQIKANAQVTQAQPSNKLEQTLLAAQISRPVRLLQHRVQTEPLPIFQTVYRMRPAVRTNAQVEAKHVLNYRNFKVDRKTIESFGLQNVAMRYWPHIRKNVNHYFSHDQNKLCNKRLSFFNVSEAANKDVFIVREKRQRVAFLEKKIEEASKNEHQKEGQELNEYRALKKSLALAEADRDQTIFQVEVAALTASMGQFLMEVLDLGTIEEAMPYQNSLMLFLMVFGNVSATPETKFQDGVKNAGLLFFESYLEKYYPNVLAQIFCTSISYNITFVKNEEGFAPIVRVCWKSASRHKSSGQRAIEMFGYADFEPTILQTVVSDHTYIDPLLIAAGCHLTTTMPEEPALDLRFFLNKVEENKKTLTPSDIEVADKSQHDSLNTWADKKTTSLWRTFFRIGAFFQTWISFLLSKLNTPSSSSVSSMANSTYENETNHREVAEPGLIELAHKTGVSQAQISSFSIP